MRKNKHHTNFHHLFTLYRLLPIIGLLLTNSLITATAQDKHMNKIEHSIAQKIIIDLRYYCVELPPKGQQCKTPLLKLPKELADMITLSNVGGVILFSENLQSIEQIVSLTTDLQHAACKSTTQQPLFISIDQEGGRVARLPRTMATSFTGNMSIGATYNKHDVKYATLTGTILAKEIKSLGFNVNHAPNVDVNVNADNPVINVRSFSENPDIVARLGLAQLNAMQKEGVITTLKHFPGHGDTNVDSHTGLPIVHHDLNTIKEVDLLPFQHAIDHGDPAMIMTAHIQYPTLDQSTLTSKKNNTIIKPATMSRKILTGLLRESMGYKGVIITDALDMAGISLFFNEAQAVTETFKAGADIALMPMAIRHKSDITRFYDLINTVTNAVVTGDIKETEIVNSVNRIKRLKTKYLTTNLSQIKLKKRIHTAINTLSNVKHKLIENKLATQSITQINNHGLLPIAKSLNKWHLIMPDETKCLAMIQSLIKIEPKLKLSCSSLQTLSASDEKKRINQADLIISANITPKQNAAEIGSMEDIAKLATKQLNKKQQDQLLEDLLIHSRKHQIPSVYMSLRAPYDIKRYGKYASATLASYAYNTTSLPNNDGSSRILGPAFDALASILLGKQKAVGKLPVTIPK